LCLRYFLENQIIDCKSCKEQDQVAVPKSGRYVVPNFLVLIGFVLVLILDSDNVLFEIKTAERKPADADKDEKYVSHVINIA